VAAGQGLTDAWLDQALKDMPDDQRARAERLAAERSGVLYSPPSFRGAASPEPINRRGTD
jgi:hypothetical protein